MYVESKKKKKVKEDKNAKMNVAQSMQLGAKW